MLVMDWNWSVETNCCFMAAVIRLTVTDSDGAQNYTFADATVLKGWLQSNEPWFTYFLSPKSCSVELMHFLAFVSLGFILFAHIRSFLWRLFWFLVLYLGCGWIWFTSTRQVISLEDRCLHQSSKMTCNVSNVTFKPTISYDTIFNSVIFLRHHLQKVSWLQVLLYGLHIHHRFVEI